ncbi:MAG: DUF4382 domain-containing protein [Candidatus Binataceae bacterium]
MKNLKLSGLGLTWLMFGIAVVALLLDGGRHPAHAFNPNNGSVEVVITDSPSGLYQQLALNAISVRLNPSTDLNLSDGAAGWQTITVPAGVGANNRSAGVIQTGLNLGGIFGVGGNTTGISQGRSEIQIDLNQLQGGNSQIFNSGRILAQPYGQVELVLDPVNPGSITPICGQSSRGEGCIAYPLTPAFPPSVTTRTIRANFLQQGSTTPVLFQVGKGTVTPLVLDISLSNVTPGIPSTGSNPSNPSNTPFTAQINLSVSLNGSSGSSVPTNPLIAMVTGNVTNLAPKDTETVNAELSGTSQIVASAVPLATNGNYSIGLPAAPGGTTYDIFVTGPDRALDILSGPEHSSNPNLTLTPGSLTTVNLNTPTQTTATLTGSVTDQCSGTPLQGAIIQLLAPDTTAAPGTDCSANPTPAGCVVVASANTSINGKYPLPGNGTVPGSFTQIPTNLTYGLKVIVSGYDPVNARVTASGSSFTSTPISGSTGVIGKGPVSFALARAQLTGTVVSSGGDRNPLDVMIMAEDHGTNHIESVGMTQIPAGQTSTTFNLLVPTSTSLTNASNPTGQLDLFASAEDLFGAFPAQYTGHTFAVLSGIPSAPASSACSAPVAVPAQLGTINCTGHGSINGNVTASTANTTVVMSKVDPSGAQVDLLASKVGPAGTINAGQFSICAPVDTYTLTHFESGVPASGSTPLNVALTPPPTIMTPCSSICPVPGSTTTCFLCQSSIPETLQ